MTGGGKFSGAGDRLGAAGVVIRMFVALGIFMVVGYLLDRFLGTDPWFLISGTLVGVAVVMYDLWKRADRGKNHEERKRG